MQLTDDVVPDMPGRRCRESQKRHAGEVQAQLREPPVFRPEIVTPFADAVGLIDGDGRHIPAKEILDESVRHDPLRGCVEEFDFPPGKRGPPEPGLLALNRRVQHRGGDAACREGIHLVFHQRDQRRNDKHEPRPRERWELEAERCSGSGGQDGHDIFSG